MELLETGVALLRTGVSLLGTLAPYIIFPLYIPFVFRLRQ